MLEKYQKLLNEQRARREQLLQDAGILSDTTYYEGMAECRGMIKILEQIVKDLQNG